MAEISLLQRQGVRQLIKFCIVGFSSMIVDKGLLWLLTIHFLLMTRLPNVPWWVWTTVTFCLAVGNGFIWNRRWTFQAQSAVQAHQQFIKFLATNIVGWVLNSCITKMFLIFFTGKVVHEQNPNPQHLLLASISAIPFVVIWNFSAAKYWTFRAPKETPSPDVQSA